MRVAVIGAGPAGITAAYELAKGGAEVEVFEAGATVGGLSRSFELWGQTVDLGPHRFFSNDLRVNKLWLEVVGKDYAMVDRLTRIYYKKQFFNYPLKPANALRNMGIFNAVACLAQLPEGKDLADLPRRPERDLRVVGRRPIRPEALRDVLQVVQGEALGHPVRQARRRFRRPADQEVLARRGDQGRPRHRQGEAQDARRSVRLSAPGNRRRLRADGRLRRGRMAARSISRRRFAGSFTRTRRSRAWSWPTGRRSSSTR